MSILNIKIIEESLENKYQKQKYKHDSGFDLYSSQDYILNPGELKFIDFGIIAQISNKIRGFFIVNRSSSIKISDLVSVPPISVIDYEYTGNLGVFIKNISSHVQKINKGDSYWQIVLPNLEPPNVRFTDKIEIRARGSNGFGSTNSKL